MSSGRPQTPNLYYSTTRACGQHFCVAQRACADNIFAWHNARVRTTILRALFLRLMTADDVRDPEDNMDMVWIWFGYANLAWRRV